MDPISPVPNQAPKIMIILKPGVLGQQHKSINLAQQSTGNVKRKKQQNECPIPASITLINPTPQENKFSAKIRNVLDGLTFAVQSYIIHNLDNEGTSQAYKSRLNTGLTKIQEDFIKSRVNIYTKNQANGELLNNNNIVPTSGQINQLSNK